MRKTVLLKVNSIALRREQGKIPQKLQALEVKDQSRPPKTVRKLYKGDSGYAR